MGAKGGGERGKEAGEEGEIDGDDLSGPFFAFPGNWVEAAAEVAEEGSARDVGCAAALALDGLPDADLGL